MEHDYETGDVTYAGVEAKQVGQIRRQIEAKVVDQMQKVGEIILRKSQGYVPVEFGHLKASGEVIVTGKGLGTTVEVRYGGPTAPYAIWVHENMEARHEPPTGPKFLERAVRETRGTTAGVSSRSLAIG